MNLWTMIGFFFILSAILDYNFNWAHRNRRIKRRNPNVF